MNNEYTKLNVGNWTLFIEIHQTKLHIFSEVHIPSVRSCCPYNLSNLFVLAPTTLKFLKGPSHFAYNLPMSLEALAFLITNSPFWKPRGHTRSYKLSSSFFYMFAPSFSPLPSIPLWGPNFLFGVSWVVCRGVVRYAHKTPESSFGHFPFAFPNLVFNWCKKVWFVTSAYPFSSGLFTK